MAVSLQSQLNITRLVDNVPDIGGIPSEAETVASTSDMMRQLYQTVTTTHETVDAGDMTDNCMVLIKNKHATAIIEVGVVVAATFYPLFTVPPGERAKLPRLSSLAGTYLKSNVVNVSVEVTLYKIA